MDRSRTIDRVKDHMVDYDAQKVKITFIISILPLPCRTKVAKSGNVPRGVGFKEKADFSVWPVRNGVS